MKRQCIAALGLSLALTGCNSSPGPLEGTWKSQGILAITIAFRPGETETMGVIEKVDYKTDGNVVNVTWKDGMMKGSTMAFTIVDRDTATNPMYTLHRMR